MTMMMVKPDDRAAYAYWVQAAEVLLLVASLLYPPEYFGSHLGLDSSAVVVDLRFGVVLAVIGPAVYQNLMNCSKQMNYYSDTIHPAVPQHRLTSTKFQQEHGLFCDRAYLPAIRYD